MNWLGNTIQKEITEFDTVLDLGCGIMQGTDRLVCKSVLGADIWEKYLNHIKKTFQTVKISMGETDRFMDESFDIVICLDVIEHLDYETAKKTIRECKRICRQKAIIYTPDEFNSNEKAISNSWDLGENPHQKHKCVIQRSDFVNEKYHVINPMNEGFLAIFRR